MEIDSMLRLRLINEAEKAKAHFINAAKIVSTECNEDEKRVFRKAADEPGRKLQNLLDELQKQT